MRSELQAMWCFLTIAVYAGGYAATKDIIKAALEPHARHPLVAGRHVPAYPHRADLGDRGV